MGSAAQPQQTSLKSLSLSAPPPPPRGEVSSLIYNDNSAKPVFSELKS